MGARFRSWWQYIRKHWLLTIGIIAALIAFILAVWWFGWDWTGFNGGYSQITTTSTSQGTTTTTAKPPEKTLWDLLQLLIIPLVLTIGGLWYSQVQKDRERRATDERARTEREIALDNQQETALQEYIDKLSELLLEKKLRESKPEDEARTIAHVRTWTALPRLDKRRKGSVLQFLYESGLITKGKNIIDLSGADFSGTILQSTDLRGADLHGAYLQGADLRQSDLHEANLSRADLMGANLSISNLSEADLSGADLFTTKLNRANLSRADLSRARLIETDLSGADLIETNLSGANLIYATVNEEQLKKAKSLEGTTLPKGSKHP